LDWIYIELNSNTLNGIWNEFNSIPIQQNSIEELGEDSIKFNSNSIFFIKKMKIGGENIEFFCSWIGLVALVYWMGKNFTTLWSTNPYGIL
jgi:hypothetical protein